MGYLCDMYRTSPDYFHINNLYERNVHSYKELKVIFWLNENVGEVECLHSTPYHCVSESEIYKLEVQ